LTTAPLFDVRIAVLISFLILPRHAALATQNVGLTRAVVAATTAGLVAVLLTGLFARRFNNDLTIQARSVLLVVALHSMIGIAAGVTFAAIALIGVNPDEVLLLADVVLGMTVRTVTGLGAVVVSSLQIQLQRQQVLLAHMTAKQDEQTQAARAAADANDTHIANLLHRTVQGRMAAIIIFLRSGHVQEAQHHLRTLIDVDLPAGLAQGFGGETSEGLESHQRRRLWTLDLPLEVTENVRQELRSNIRESVFDALSGITAEAGVNAMKHGGARRMSVTLRIEGDNLVLECIDDGRAVVGFNTTGAGLGSAVYDDFAEQHRGKWSLSTEPTGTTFRIVIPAEHGLTQFPEPRSQSPAEQMQSVQE
jgi:signal transduction histidine kinase